MTHPFVVGKVYRNRIGIYEVLRIDGDEIDIRYADGQVQRSSVAFLARIWENIQEEEEAGGREIEVDFAEGQGTDRSTEEIRDFVNDVLATLPTPLPPDVTDQVFLAVENNPGWLRTYERLTAEFGMLTVNSSMGYWVRDLTGMETTGKQVTAKSKLITSYTILHHVD